MAFSWSLVPLVVSRDPAWAGTPPAVALRSGRHLLRFVHDLVEIGKRLPLAALPGPANDALGIDYEDRPIGHAGIARHVLPAHAVGVNHPSLEIGDQIEGEATELLDERLVRENAVDADAVKRDPGVAQLILP